MIISGDATYDPQFTEIVNNLPLKPGDAFDHRRYIDIKTRLAQLASEHGFFDARFTEHNVLVDLAAYHADIQLKFESGRRYRYGEISLRQEILYPSFLERYVPFKSGDPFNINDLIELQQALTDSNYFQDVEVSPAAQVSDTATIPVEAILVPRKTHRYLFGLGYGTDTGARAKAGWEVPRVNKNGHKFSAEAKVSELGYSLGGRYIVPILDPRTDQLIYSGVVKHEELDTTISTIRSLGIGLNHGRGLWREILALNYQEEQYIIANVPGESVLLMPGVNWQRTWGERIYTLDGLALDFGLKGASKDIVSDTEFLQMNASVKGISRLSTVDRFIGRLRVGATSTNEFDKLPASVRFFAGGSQSVRGYAYQSLGPVDSSGNVVGGKYLFVGALEYEHVLRGKWSAAVFFDKGNAINSFTDKLFSGAGVGLRWQSPIGSIRFDFAKALDLTGVPWRIHINIGPDL